MQSMTGFGRSEATIAGTSFALEIKSVNHRFLDARFRFPSAFSAFESALLDELKKFFQRGSFEIVLRQKHQSGVNVSQGGTRFVLDETALGSLVQQIPLLQKQLGTTQSLSPDAVVSLGKILIPVEEEVDTEERKKDLFSLFRKTCTELQTMRSKEGSSIAVQLERELAEIRRIAAEITKLAIGHPAETRRKLQERIESWNLGTKLAPERLEWELAFYADRADITEELDRIDSHTKSFLEWVQSKDAIGRKLDFLTQELHREVNTLGTKAGLLEITQRVIQLKNCIEKLREQVQNVE